MYTIEIKHNVEMAHRLSNPDAPSKCQHIHGHSWQVTLVLEGDQLNDRGMLLEFGFIKERWRALLDGRFDHRLAVTNDDPLSDLLGDAGEALGLVYLDDQPTTENMARLWFFEARHMLSTLGIKSVLVDRVHVQETATNAAEYNR